MLENWTEKEKCVRRPFEMQRGVHLRPKWRDGWMWEGDVGGHSDFGVKEIQVKLRCSPGGRPNGFRAVWQEREGKKLGKHICDIDEGNLWFGQSSLQVGFQPERQQQGGAGNWGQSEGSVLVSLMFRIQCEMSYLSSISCRIDIWYAIFMIFDVYIRDENNLVMNTQNI